MSADSGFEQKLSQATGSEDDASLTSHAVGTSQHFRWLEGIVKWMLVLNLCDALFTLVWVRWGLAREANTLLDELVNENAVAFVATKLGLVSLGSWVLWQRRSRPLAVIAIFIAFVLYYLVLLYHVQYASGLLRQLLSA
ncbi:MAG: hypothetical protein JRH16_07250 [Deltaproteobacteria bacterium]|nr:hypothetical protein [Deltaproteobacteria bacterium]MBW2359999.1 hypothetical protein [Deltaproteobacteria bacterium]